MTEQKPRVVIVRGDWLCKRDTLYYEPLADRFDLRGVSVRRTSHDLSLVRFPVVSPWSLDSAIARLGLAQNFLDKALRLRSENLMWFWGFDKICGGADILDVAETFHPFCRQAAEFRRKNDVRLVIRAHENIPFAHHNLAYRRETKKLVFETADAFITCSRLGQLALEMEGAPAEKIFVIPIGTDLSAYSPRPRDAAFGERMGVSQDDFVVLYAGRMNWEKGALACLYAAARLKSIPHLRIVLAGDGPDASAMRRYVDDMGLSDLVTISGRVPTDQMPALYSLADVVVVPSIATPKWQEQFGAVVMEAMACGKALVVSDSGSIPEVAGDAAVYVPQGNHLGLAEAIERLERDRSTVAEMGKRARERAEERFDNHVVARQIGALYESLLES